MEITDKKIFAEMWGAVRSDVYDKPVSAAGISLIFNTLKRFSVDQVREGIELHVNDVQSGNFPITPAHVVAQIEGRGDDRGGSAWRKLYGAIGSVGNYSDVVFDDPIIHAIVDNEGGWQHVSLMTDEDTKFLQARFNKQYNGYVSKSGQFEYPRVLRGATNADRTAKGLPPVAPETVGDVERCRMVYRGGIETTLEIGRPKDMQEFLTDAPERDDKAGLASVTKLLDVTGLKRGNQ